MPTAGSLLQEVPLFKLLDADERSTLAAHLDVVEVKRGQRNLLGWRPGWIQLRGDRRRDRPPSQFLGGRLTRRAASALRLTDKPRTFPRPWGWETPWPPRRAPHES
jgi:hypothetical protein